MIHTLFYDLFFDYTLRTVTLGVSLLGIVSGVLGAFATLRRQSLLGDAISHAALPGIVIAFLLTRSKEPSVMMIGAGLAGSLGTLAILRITNDSRLKYDSALGIVLSVFFGFGMMLLTFTQRLPDARQAGLDKFLFGQAATLLTRDVLTMALMGGIGRHLQDGLLPGVLRIDRRSEELRRRDRLVPRRHLRRRLLGLQSGLELRTSATTT